MNLRDAACECGLDAVGACAPTHEVSELFPWARSVFCAALSYLSPDAPQPDGAAFVARFARSADYHEVLSGRLERLAALLKDSYPGVKLQICVDTAPLPERKLAHLAGIGWIGKNSNIYVDGCGSYVALGELVTDIPIECNQTPIDSKCGSCRICIDACPSGAIGENGGIEQSRCLSAATQSGALCPADARKTLGTRIYGCDTCLDSCPHNANIAPRTPDFCAPEPFPSILELLNISKNDYNLRIGRKPYGWIGRNRIRRNAAIAAGNARLAQAVPDLEKMISDASPAVREAAAWSLSEILKSNDTEAEK